MIKQIKYYPRISKTHNKLYKKWDSISFQIKKCTILFMFTLVVRRYLKIDGDVIFLNFLSKKKKEKNIIIDII